MAKRWILLLGAGVCVAVIAVTVFRPADALLYNHSPSIAVGFYVRTDAPPVLGSIVTVRAADVAPYEARARGFDEEGDRFIKHVAAVAGQRVCSDGESLTVDGAVVVRLRDARAGAPRVWVGCRVLRGDEILLLGDSADSFDGRYWGPISATLIEGVWRKL